MRRLEVQGHRGMKGLYPENKLAGFQAAIDAGVDVIECDVLATSDAVLIIHHDFVCNGSLVRNLSLAEIKRYDPEIPTLEELLSLVQRDSKIRLNLEIKRDARHPEWTFEPNILAKKIVAQCRLLARVYYSSFDPEVLLEIRKMEPVAEIGLVFGTRGLNEIPASILECANSLQARIFSPEHSYLKNKSQVQSLQKMGFRIIPWTVNEPNRWKELIEMGVDGIVTDYPISLLDFVKQHEQ